MNNLKNIIVFLLCVFVNYTIAKDINITNGKTYFSVTDKSITNFTFINSVSDIQAVIVKTEERNFVKLVIPSYGSDSKNGDAELPVLQKLIRIPFGSDISFNILNKEEEIINLSDFGYDLDVFPNQPSISKDENAEQVPFYYNNQYYNINDFIGNNLIKTQLLGKMRGQQLARLSVSPISYNPVTNQLKIITKIEVIKVCNLYSTFNFYRKKSILFFYI